MSQGLRNRIDFFGEEFSKGLNYLCKFLEKNRKVESGGVPGFNFHSFKSVGAEQKAQNLLDKLVSQYIEGIDIDLKERKKWAYSFARSIFLDSKCTAESLFANIERAVTDAAKTLGKKSTSKTPVTTTSSTTVPSIAKTAVKTASAVLSKVVSPSNLATAASGVLNSGIYGRSYRSDQCAVPNFWEAPEDDAGSISMSEMAMVAGGTVLAAYGIQKLIGMGRYLLGRVIGDRQEVAVTPRVEEGLAAAGRVEDGHGVGGDGGEVVAAVRRSRARRRRGAGGAGRVVRDERHEEEVGTANVDDIAGASYQAREILVPGEDHSTLFGVETTQPTRGVEEMVFGRAGGDEGLAGAGYGSSEILSNDSVVYPSSVFAPDPIVVMPEENKWIIGNKAFDISGLSTDHQTILKTDLRRAIDSYCSDRGPNNINIMDEESINNAYGYLATQVFIEHGLDGRVISRGGR